jgi:lipopolysaccharide/colanic/teichoic acid biosynthesis glycosyltransferase
MPEKTPDALSSHARFAKRALDIALACMGLLLTSWIILTAAAVAALDTGQSGFFRQSRVGRHGKAFDIIKIRTMRPSADVQTMITTASDPRITPFGRFLRRTKVDELPQLWNILVGDMSFVGPRPDVSGYADRLVGADRIVLSVRPGITGPATLAFRDEETILASTLDPARYNDEVIFPTKVRLNREYVENYSFWRDISYLVRTVFRMTQAGPKP